MKLKSILISFAVLIFITLIIPTLLVLPFKEEMASSKLSEQLDNSAQIVASEEFPIDVAVYRTETQTIEQLPLENYVVGVVASEMPADFELEALKAQALAARTYIVKQLLTDDKLGLPEGASVTDTELHQVYKNNDDLKELWGKDYKKKIDKITTAVSETAGQILTFKGEPIAAQFFSTSNGYTENSEAYWSSPFAYLTTVESPWDKQSPKYYDKKTFTINDFERLLNLKLTNSGELGEIIERTPGKRVSKVKIADKIFTGREIRERLDLQSTDFQLSRHGDQIVIETKGYGHGVGMSQYGANGMALEGKTYDEIVKYYYTGVDISKTNTHLAKLTAKK